MSDVTLDEIVSLCKRRGFIYQGSEIYGGLSGTWDYGPLGVALKRNVMNLWWKMFVEDREDMFGIDAAILMNQKVWQASGHVDTFTDPMVECQHCKSRFRVDHLVDNDEYENETKEYFTRSLAFVDSLPAKYEEYSQEQVAQIGDIFGHAQTPATYPNQTTKELREYLSSNQEQAKKYLGNFPRLYLMRSAKKCEKCGSIEWGDTRTFNMMFETKVGPFADTVTIKPPRTIEAGEEIALGGPTGWWIKPSENTVYLRPETAQGIFTNFKNVVDSLHPGLPFGLAQQGKAFRNEVSPRDFVFRSREFEQMEIEYFVHSDRWEEAFEQWRLAVHEWTKALGLPEEKVHELEAPETDRAHYSKRTIDFEFDFPHGRDELLGLAYRTDFDLMNIQNATGKSMEYQPKDGGPAFVPHVIEPSFGVERAIMAALTSAYTEDEVNGEKRTYLKLPTHLAPVKVAVFPLLKNKPELVAKAREVYAMLKKEFGAVMWDDNGNIGKRYRRQDEIGTPHCVTIDFQTLEDQTVTVRNRDTTEQTRIKIADLIAGLD